MPEQPSMLNDLRFALRLLWKSPGFTTVAILALALGIGANTAIFSLVNSVLLRPLPFRDSNRLAIFWETDPAQGFNRQGPSGPNYIDFRDQSKSFEDMALSEQGTGTVTGFGEPQQIPALRVTRSFLPVLGFTPILGRNFLASEGWHQRVVIIGYGAWERYYGKDRNVVGKKMLLDDIPYTVIGVLPSSFWFPDPGELIVPWVDADLLERNRNQHSFGVFGHLKPGVTVQQANAELNAIEHRIGEQFVGLRDWATTVVLLSDVLSENVRSGLLLLLAAVALVLLIACANLANLMLARAAGRTRETAIRMALGAGRWRLARQFLTESAVLGSLGGVLGLLLALWGVDLLDHVVPQSMPLSGGAGIVVRPAIHADAWALFFTVAISLATGLIFGLAPAFAASKARVNEALKEGSRGSSAGGNRLRNAFAVSEVGLALVLLIGAGLVMKSFWRIQQVNPGFSAEHVLALEMELPTDSKYRTRPEQTEFFRRVLENVRSLPMVRSAGVTNQLPLDTSDEPRAEFSIVGRAPLPSGQGYLADYRNASPDYFRVMGIPLLKGRVFTDQDKADRPLVAIINETFARRYWPDGVNPIGQRLRLGPRFIPEIVGIVGDVKSSALNQQTAPAMYTSYLQIPEAKMSLIVRAEGDPAKMIRAVERQVWAVDKDQPMYKIRTMQQVVNESQSSSRFTLALLAIFAAVAMGLAAVGIYGVISYTVTQRTREIGIRIALGAARRDVLRLVVGQGTILAVSGVAAGLTGALALTRVMRNLLFGVSATDPFIFAGAALFLAAVALLASYIPARRAMRVDPTVSLRYD
ncbi:MAG TPA: ABC transporter permease [Bryobacteraceae bacterium]|nr:ABC transporter permease [Bryobacteraceae bacterium]